MLVVREGEAAGGEEGVGEGCRGREEEVGGAHGGGCGRWHEVYRAGRECSRGVIYALRS